VCRQLHDLIDARGLGIVDRDGGYFFRERQAIFWVSTLMT
jgi:hypothetical protein